MLCFVEVGALTPNEFKYGGTPGGNDTTWIGLGKYRADAYKPVRINMSHGFYNRSDRKTFDVTITSNDGQVFISGSGLNIVGYVLSGNTINIYLKIATTCSYTGFITGELIEKLDNVVAEPAGIAYIA